MANFQLQIISPDQVEFEGQVESVVAPGDGGYFGVMAHHQAMLSSLGDGTLTVTPSGEPKQNYQVSSGFLEVSKNKAVILVQEIETIEESSGR